MAKARAEMPATTRRILGIDPGLRVTGYAILEETDQGPRICEAGVVRSGSDELAVRVKTLYDGICEALDQWKPGVMAVEQLYAHYDHPRTAILMAHVRGGTFLPGLSEEFRSSVTPRHASRSL